MPPHSLSPSGNSNRSSMKAEGEQFGEEAHVSTMKITPGVCPLVSHNPLCSGCPCKPRPSMKAELDTGNRQRVWWHLYSINNNKQNIRINKRGNSCSAQLQNKSPVDCCVLNKILVYSFNK